jgi:hypothetical protein
MKKNMLYLQGFLVMIMTGCKKTAPMEEPMARLEGITQTMFNGNPYNAKDEFVYEEDGKRIKEVKEYRMNNAPVHKRYNYKENQVQYRYYRDGVEQTSEAINYTLNTEGLVAQQENLYSGNRIVYEYNEFQYLKKISYSRMGIPDGYSKYYYKSGNVLDSIELYDNNNTAVSVSIFEYATGKKNSIGNKNKGLQIFGKSQAAPLKTETRIIKNYPGTNGIRFKSFEFDYEYTFDMSGRITGSTTNRTDYSYPGNNSTFFVYGVYEYTYE